MLKFDRSTYDVEITPSIGSPLMAFRLTAMQTADLYRCSAAGSLPYSFTICPESTFGPKAIRAALRYAPSPPVESWIRLRKRDARS